MTDFLLHPRGRGKLSPSVEIGDAGLLLGAATHLVRRTGPRTTDRLALDADRGRLLALLSVAAHRPVSAEVIVHVEAASAFWQRGDKALANLRLVFAGLPRLDGPLDADCLRLAEWLLDEGLSPRNLMKDLGLDTAVLDAVKYDPNQPRVPARSGPAGGQWTSGDASSALLGLLGATRPSFLAGTSPDIVAALAAFAARFATPTAVLGALLIPTPNSGGVTDGTLPGAPEIKFQKDAPAGRLRITINVDDGAEVMVHAENQRGVYADVKTGNPLRRDFGEQMCLDLDAVRDAFRAEKTASTPASIRWRRSREGSGSKSSILSRANVCSLTIASATRAITSTAT